VTGATLALIFVVPVHHHDPALPGANEHQQYSHARSWFDPRGSGSDRVKHDKLIARASPPGQDKLKTININAISGQGAQNCPISTDAAIIFPDGFCYNRSLAGQNPAVQIKLEGL